MLHKIIRGNISTSNTAIKADGGKEIWDHILLRFKNDPALRDAINLDREWGGRGSVWSKNGYELDAQTGLSFNSPSPVRNGREDAIDFIDALENILEEETIVSLRINGSFTIVIDTDSMTLTYLVTIVEGQLIYKRQRVVE